MVGFVILFIKNGVRDYWKQLLINFPILVSTSWLCKICGRYKSRLHFLINEMNRPLVCRRWCKSQASYLDCPRTYKVSSKRGSPPSPLFALVLLRSFVRCSSLSSVILQQCSVLESAGVRSIVGARANGQGTVGRARRRLPLASDSSCSMAEAAWAAFRVAPACVPRGARAAWCAGGRLRRSRPTCCARFDQDLIQGVRKPFVQTPSDAITLRRAVRSFTGYWKVDEIGFFSVGTNLILICFSFHIVV